MFLNCDNHQAVVLVDEQFGYRLQLQISFLNFLSAEEIIQHTVPLLFKGTSIKTIK